MMARGPVPQVAKCHPDRKHYALGLCNTCWQRKWREENPDLVAAGRRRHRVKYPEKFKQREHKRTLRRYHNMTVNEYEEMLIAHGGVCAICGGVNRLRRLAVDHDHKTGEVRGLLCNLCNRGIGAFKDDPEILRRAIAYLANPANLIGGKR